jgi:hypothetical protein
MVYISPREEEVMRQVSLDHRVTALSAAYTLYVEITPGNKKPLSQRDFYRLYRDNWDVFYKLEAEGTGQS